MEKKREKQQKQQETPEAAAPAEETPAAGSPEEELERLKQEIVRLNEQLGKRSEEAEDFKRKWYSVSAEYENYRKRTAATRASAYAEGRADVVSKLFPIADNLERALAACTDEGTKKGISMVTASFEALLKEEKIETIDPLGQPFDAEESEAIMALDPEEGETSGTVKQVYRKGYKQNGKVLRFAQVVVVK